MHASDAGRRVVEQKDEEPLFAPTPSFRRLLDDLVRNVREQAVTINQLRSELDTQRKTHEHELAELRSSLVSANRELLSLRHALNDMEKLRSEMTELNEKRERSDKHLEHLAVQLERHDSQLQHQTDLNAIRAAEIVMLTDKLDKPEAGHHHNTTESTTSPRPGRSEDGQGGNASNRPCVAQDSVLHNILAVFEMSADGLNEASGKPSVERIRFLHHLPAFRAIWVELFRMHNAVVKCMSSAANSRGWSPESRCHPVPVTIAGDNGQPRRAAKERVGGNAFTSSSPHTAVHRHESLVQGYDPCAAPESLFVPQLGAELGRPLQKEKLAGASSQTPTSYHDAPSGTVVRRVVPGSFLARCGVVPGDVIVECDGALVADAHHLASLVESFNPEKPPLLTIIPNNPTQTPLRVSYRQSVVDR